ncbi:MAG: hypothetical protein DDT19_00099 [Syntrophomonadaceae bacterium]|nr:hypothetical protein [Bacillota bacterium]
MGQTIDILCTFDHRFVTTKRLKEARDIGYNDRIPLNGEYAMQDYPIEDRILALIGWIATDGHARNKSANSCEYVIYQKKEPYLSEIKNLLGPGNYSESKHPHSHTSALYIRNPLKAEIQNHYKDKADLISLVLKLSKRQLLILKEVMFKAEGNVCYPNSVVEFSYFAQKDPDIKTAYQLILLLTGQNSRLAQKGIYLKKKKVAKGLHPQVVWHEGIIWCPKTENQTWIMRRNGKIIPTGNTWSRKNLPLQLEYLLKKPGQYAALAKTPNFARWIAQSPPEDLPDWAKDMLMLRLPWTNAKGEPIYLSPDLPPEDLEIFNAVPGLSQDLKEGASQEVVARLTPFIKAPLEWVSNYNFFFAAPRYPGQTVRPPWWIEQLPPGWQEKIGVTVEEGERRIPSDLDWFLSQFPAVPGIRGGISGLIEPTERTPLDIARYLTGLRLYATPQKGKREIIFP